MKFLIVILLKMLRRSCNVFDTHQISIISKSFQNIKNNQYGYPQKISHNDSRDIKSLNIIREQNMANIFDNLIYNEIYKINGYRDINLYENYILWKSSKDKNFNHNLDFDSTIAVITNKPLVYEFSFGNQKLSNQIKSGDILFYNGGVSIKFFNHQVADLAFFHCQYNEVIMQNEEQYCAMG